ncbi:Uncharacterised protein [Mycobacteroides abscessus subsp. abscessus]|nr:Uncharacterised protein [Mycobacteroides abscessus subsp. abscessus]
MLAKQEFLLLLLHPVADVVGDLVGDLGLGDVLAGPVDQQLQSFTDIRRLEELSLLDVVEPRRVARRVGEIRRVGHLVDRVDDLPRLTTLQHGQYELLVLGGQRLGLGRRLDVVDLGYLDPQCVAVAGGSGADVGARFALDDGSLHTAGHTPDLHDRRQNAIGGIPVVQAGSDQQFSGLTGPGRVHCRLSSVVERHRHNHAGQDDQIRNEEDGH